VTGSTAVVTDHTIVPEGSPYTREQGLRFLTGAGSITYDLGDTVPIAAVFLQVNVIGLATYYHDIRYYLESIAVIAFALWATWMIARRHEVPRPAVAAAGENGT
jgi:hypothetical protein